MASSEDLLPWDDMLLEAKKAPIFGTFAGVYVLGVPDAFV